MRREATSFNLSTRAFVGILLALSGNAHATHPFMQEVDLYFDLFEKGQAPNSCRLQNRVAPPANPVPSFCDKPFEAICGGFSKRKEKQEAKIRLFLDRVDREIMPELQKKYGLPAPIHAALMDPNSYTVNLVFDQAGEKKRNRAILEYYKKLEKLLEKYLPGGMTLEDILEHSKRYVEKQIDEQEIPKVVKDEMKSHLAELDFQSPATLVRNFRLCSHDPRRTENAGIQKTIGRKSSRFQMCIGTIVGALDLDDNGKPTGKLRLEKIANLMGHELSHTFGLASLEAFRGKKTKTSYAYQGFSRCVRDRWAKKFIIPEDWFDQLDEASADIWGIETLLRVAKDLKIKDRKKLLQLIQDSVEKYCQKSAMSGDSHGTPAFRIGLLIGQHPEVRKAFGCQPTDESQNYCRLFDGKSIDFKGPHFDFKNLMDRLVKRRKEEWEKSLKK